LPDRRFPALSLFPGQRPVHEAQCSSQTRPPKASILFDKLHILRHLGEALGKVRKSEYARLTGQDRRFITGQTYTLLSHKVALGFVEGLTNRVRVLQRRAYGLRDEDYLRLKVLTCMLPEL
jgi:transposase